MFIQCVMFILATVYTAERCVYIRYLEDDSIELLVYSR